MAVKAQDHDPDGFAHSLRVRKYPVRRYYSYPNFEGGNLTTYSTGKIEVGNPDILEGWEYDDLYCYILGALKNMDPEMDSIKITNYKGWAALAAQKCAKIQE